MELELGLSFFTGSRSTPRRRITALVAGCAVVLQALVFAWHHHEVPFAARGVPVVAVAASGSTTPATVDRDCPICSAIAHHGAVPVDTFAPLPPDGRALQQLPPATMRAPLAPYLLFRSRAPPRA